MKKFDPVKTAAYIYLLLGIIVFIETIIKLAAVIINSQYLQLSQDAMFRVSILLSLFTALFIAVLSYATYNFKRVAYRLSVVLFLIIMFTILVPFISRFTKDPIGYSLYSLLYLIPVLLVVANKERMGN